VIIGEGGKRWKSTKARRMALLINICIIIHRVRANESGNYIHRENR
jgi:hypothetical protein